MKRGAEFSLYQGGSPARRTPHPPTDNLNLRTKQRSLTNLTLLSDVEQRLYSPEPDEPRPRGSQTQTCSWYLPSTQRAASSLQTSPRKEVVRRAGGLRGTRAQSLSLPLTLTKTLSQSEHSLIPVLWRGSAAGARPQQASHGGHSRTELQQKSRVEVETEDDGRSCLFDKEVRPGTKQGGRRRRSREGWAEEEVSEGGPREGRAQLDKDMIMTMLGDLEQVLQPHTRKSTSPRLSVGSAGPSPVRSSQVQVQVQSGPVRSSQQGCRWD